MSRKENICERFVVSFALRFKINRQDRSSTIGFKGSQAVWILKGAFLGLWVFVFGTLVFLYLAVLRNLRPNTAVGLSVLAGYTTWNPLWWAALLIAIVGGCWVTRSWPGKSWFWISLVVTFLFPAGLIGFLLARASKLRHTG
jgi:hypothetical protein